MKTTAALLIALLVAGCSDMHAPWRERAYGSWLDNVGRLPNPRLEISEEEAASLTAEAVRLRAQAEALRLAIAADPDRVRRFKEYSELREVNDDLAPIERRLTDAGRLSRARTPG